MARAPPPIDLLEYQGKQLFARHGVPVPQGAPATTVEQAVAAADEVGYPCVVKAQVLIGGRGKAGGIKVALDRDTKLCVSGITGREGTFHSLNNKRYGTSVVSGVTPGKAGQDVDGIPVFNTFRDAVEQTGANTAMIFVPRRFAADSILEAEDAGIALIVAITEGIPAHDELRVYNHLAHNEGVRLVGPNCPGILSPGKANVGIIPAAFFKEGNVGVVSRSGTLTYQIGNELAVVAGAEYDGDIGFREDYGSPHPLLARLLG